MSALFATGAANRVRWGGLALIAFLIVWYAWLCDDAYIVFRTVDNFVHGHGLRWNVVERVQAFTCPLWTLLSASVFALTREAYFTHLALSFVLSLATVWLLLFRLARTAWAAALCIAVLVASRGFIDYSTSGLENPLSHLLLVLFVLELLRESPDGAGPRAFRLSLIASLLVTNRMDHGLLVLPSLVMVLVENRSWRTLGRLALGQLPFLAWELFSIAYYGFPFPNTAYAKLYTGIPSSEFLMQGLRYFWVTLQLDPVTLFAPVAALALCLFTPQRRLGVASIGLVLYALYIARVGGDFMAGRFLTAPLIFGLALAASSDPRFGSVLGWFRRSRGGGPDSSAPARSWIARAARAVPLTSLALGACALLSVFGPLGGAIAEMLGRPPLRLFHSIELHGLADERAFYFPGMGLRSMRRDEPMPYFPFRDQGDVDRRNWPTGGVGTATTVGLQGYFAGPKLHYVDRWALTDPLLARLPTRVPHLVRVGHYERRIPEGYLTTLRTGQNALADPKLAEFWRHLKIITRGPIWTMERWRTIVAMNTGEYDHLVRR